MKKRIILFEQACDGFRCQELYDVDNKLFIYCVFDLIEYTREDILIGRELISSDDFLDIVKLGMSYSKAGYDEIELKYVECPEGKTLNKFIKEYLDNANNDK